MVGRYEGSKSLKADASKVKKHPYKKYKKEDDLKTIDSNQLRSDKQMEDRPLQTNNVEAWSSNYAKTESMGGR